MDYFLMKFANFCCHGNKGGSNKDLDDSVWLAYPQNPQFGAKILDLSLLQAELWWIVWKFQIFVTMATGVVCHKFHLHSLIGRPRNPPIWCKNIDDISYTSWVMADFCWNLPIFVAMATRVGLTKIWMTQFAWPTPKPPVRCKNLGPILNASWVMVNIVCENFQIFVAMATGVVWHKFHLHS